LCCCVWCSKQIFFLKIYFHSSLFLTGSSMGSWWAYAIACILWIFHTGLHSLCIKASISRCLKPYYLHNCFSLGYFLCELESSSNTCLHLPSSCTLSPCWFARDSDHNSKVSVANNVFLLPGTLLCVKSSPYCSWCDFRRNPTCLRILYSVANSTECVNWSLWVLWLDARGRRYISHRRRQRIPPNIKVYFPGIHYLKCIDCLLFHDNKKLRQFKGLVDCHPYWKERVSIYTWYSSRLFHG